jgi:predicted HTH domain antitoxin
MALLLSIPDDILDALKIPREKVEKELKKELAFLLYEQGLASMGTARKLARISKRKFIEGLAERKILRHYTERELLEDIEYAKSCK